MKLFAFPPAAVLGASLLTMIDAAPCVAPYANMLKVTCVAWDGKTERQFPKDTSLPTYAAQGTDCNSIEPPAVASWRECLRTVRFDFNWTYLGLDEATLGSIKRDISNTLGEYPQETVPIIKSYWGEELYPGIALSETFHEIVVDICLQPITYSYKLLMEVEMPGGKTCSDGAQYIYAINANMGVTQGYSQFKDSSTEKEKDGAQDEQEMSTPDVETQQQVQTLTNVRCCSNTNFQRSDLSPYSWCHSSESNCIDKCKAMWICPGDAVKSQSETLVAAIEEEEQEMMTPDVKVENNTASDRVVEPVPYITSGTGGEETEVSHGRTGFEHAQALDNGLSSSTSASAHVKGFSHFRGIGFGFIVIALSSLVL